MTRFVTEDSIFDNAKFLTLWGVGWMVYILIDGINREHGHDQFKD